MIKKILTITFIYLFYSTYVFSAGSDGGDGVSSKIKTNYEKAVVHIKSAKKYEKKGNLDKAKKRYAKAQKLLIKSNDKTPYKADTLNSVSYTHLTLPTIA